MPRRFNTLCHYLLPPPLPLPPSWDISHTKPSIQLLYIIPARCNILMELSTSVGAGKGPGRGLAVSVAWLALAGVLGVCVWWQGGCGLRIGYSGDTCLFFMLQSALARNHITYNAIISACEKGEQWQQALELFERTLGDGVQRNTITYNAAITACEKGLQKLVICFNT